MSNDYRFTHDAINICTAHHPIIIVQMQTYNATSDAHTSSIAASQKLQFMSMYSQKTGVVKQQVMMIFNRYSRPFSVLCLKCRQGLLSHGF